MGGSSLLLVLSLPLLLYVFSSDSGYDAALSSLSLENPIQNVKPLPFVGNVPNHGSKEALSCERVQIVGLSRLKLGSYASSLRVTLAPSVVIPDRLLSKIEVCLHRNGSCGLCHCEKDQWMSVQKGIWSALMSPYENKYIDVKFVGDIPGSVTVSLEEEFQHWRLIFLGAGFILLLVAPIISSWVPFYYSSSMAIGVLLVIIILLFQGMKLLPTGKKNVFYLTIYGSVVGAGSFLLHQFSLLVNSILVNFGLNEEMHNPVFIFLLVGIVLAGAALGYWIVRRYIIADDGSVDVNIAEFVKWAMRIIAATFILQSTPDTPLALLMVGLCMVVCLFITSIKWRNARNWSPRLKKTGQATLRHSRAEFLSKSAKMGSQGKLWNSPSSPPSWSGSPIKGTRFVSPSPQRGMSSQKDYYSTFYQTPKRRKFSRKEWENFTRESTREAMAELMSSPDFTDWMIEHAGRVQLVPDNSSDDSAGSGSNSSGEVLSGNRLGFLNW
ncbi:hypothetical protein Nepgr_028397 [Nepenthes gracilis]|uniref:Uncharacterized protein n=1 Tax=Nepenthes gracilis TaxID=150966 RepID=A0AAD3TCS6_NEPGR|nr:hypothetical protein Nepgr_028397 [Nepenthes gracilis]